MVKYDDSVKLLSGALEILEATLEEIPAVELRSITTGPSEVSQQVDLLAYLTVFAREYTLVGEISHNGQPRYVRTTALSLRDQATRLKGQVVPILIARYLSPRSRAVCKEYEVGHLDLEGNVRLAFDGILVERQVASKPPTARRELKTLFKPKSAQVLRAMLHEPARAWRVVELANAADVSLGHVSNVRKALLDREWAQTSSRGVSLTDPDALLNAWQETYAPPAGKQYRLYTPLHGRGLDEAIRRAFHAMPPEGVAALGSFSAANWLAPYGRVSMQYFYANDAGFEHVRSILKASSVPKGENIVITVPNDAGILSDTVRPTPDIACTSWVQTYLDLSIAGERGREAADQLRRTRGWHR